MFIGYKITLFLGYQQKIFPFFHVIIITNSYLCIEIMVIYI